jgi:hypothetical protein
MVSHYVYVMQAGEFIKIGFTSRSITSRARQVQTGCPIPIEEIMFFRYENKQDALNDEKRLHQDLKQHHTHGEWFMTFSRYMTKISKIVNKKYEITRLNEKDFFINHIVRERRYEKMLKHAKNRVEKLNDEDGLTAIVNDMTVSEHVAYLKKKHSSKNSADNKTKADK